MDHEFWKAFEPKEEQESPRPVKAVEAEPAPPQTIMPNTYMAAGKMLEKHGDLQAAIGQYERAIVAEPRLSAAYNSLGVLYQKMGRLDDAILILSQGIKADPGSAALRNNLGCAYLAQRKYPEAEKAFRDSLVKTPQFQRARMNLAISLANMGRTDESLIEFSRVVAPDVAHYNVAVICMQRGDYGRCLNSLQQALAINPDCPGALEQLARVERLAAGSAGISKDATTDKAGTLAGTPVEGVGNVP